MRPNRFLTTLAAILVTTLAPRSGAAQIGGSSLGGSTTATYGTTYNGTPYPGRQQSDGPDLWADTFDPRDDEDTWDARFVTDLLWEQRLEDRPVTGPLHAGDLLIVAYAGRSLRAYADKDGTTRWSVDIPGDVAGALVAHVSGDFLLATRQGHLIRIHPADGTQVYRTELGMEVAHAPAATRDMIVVSGANESVVGIDAVSGSVKWRAGTTGHGLTAPALAPDGKLALVGDQEGRVHALTIGDGKVAWSHETGASILAAPVCNAKLAFVVSGDRRMAALDLDDGDVKWRRRLGAGAAAAPVIAEDDDAGELVIVATLDNLLQAVRARTGFRLWKARLPRRILESPQISGPVVWATPFASSEVRGFMLKNGYPLGKAELERHDDYSVGRAEAGERTVACVTYGRRLAYFKRITSKQVEDGEEELPERDEDELFKDMPSTMRPGPTGLPGQPEDPGATKKKHGLAR